MYDKECTTDEDTVITVTTKWMLDDCSSTDEIGKVLDQVLVILQKLKQEGWEFEDPIDDNWGFIIRKHPLPEIETQPNKTS